MVDTNPDVAKVGTITLLDGAMIGVSKIAFETGFSYVPYVGNGNFISGGVKTATALIVGSISKRKVAQIISTGILVDGMEDLALATKNYLVGKFGGSGQTSEVSAFA